MVSSEQITRESLQGHTAQVNSIAFHTAQTLLSAADDGTARVWDLRTNRGVHLLKHEAPVNKVLSLAQEYAVTATDKQVHFFDLRKPQLVVNSLKNTLGCSDEINDVGVRRA